MTSSSAAASLKTPLTIKGGVVTVVVERVVTVVVVRVVVVISGVGITRITIVHGRGIVSVSTVEVVILSISFSLSLGFSFSLPNKTPLTIKGGVVTVVVERVVTV